MSPADFTSDSPELLGRLPEPTVPPISGALGAALDALEPVRTRRPIRELLIFVALSVPFLGMMLLLTGPRADLGQLSPLWLIGVGSVWVTSYVASAYIGFVPAKGHIAPRSRSATQIVLACATVVIAVGLFATQRAAIGSVTYAATFNNVVAHAGTCAIMGFGSAIMPGLIALFLMRRFVPVGRTSIGLSLGAAGGSLSGLALLVHCPITERFHVGLVHGSAIVTAAIFVAGASQILLRER